MHYSFEKVKTQAQITSSICTAARATSDLSRSRSFNNCSIWSSFSFNTFYNYSMALEKQINL